MNDVPCETCITFAICKSRMFYENIIVYELLLGCPIVNAYTKGKNGADNIDKIRNFFNVKSDDVSYSIENAKILYHIRESRIALSDSKIHEKGENK